MAALDDRFDDLIASLGGFHRSWLVYLGIELGLFARLREAGPAGLAPAELAAATGTREPAVEAWGWAVGTAVLWAGSYFFWRRLELAPTATLVSLRPQRA